MKKWIIIPLLYIGVFSLVYLNYEFILEWVRESDYKHLPFMFFISLLISTIPVIPFAVFASMMGAKYGLFWGSCINWFGGVSASIIFFLLAKYSFSLIFQRIIEKYRKLDKFHHMINENAFTAVLFTRLIPLVPPPVVNIYSGISGMSLKTYTFATMIGKIPGMILYAYVGYQLFVSYEKIAIGIVLYLFFLGCILFLYRRWFKVRRVSPTD